LRMGVKEVKIGCLGTIGKYWPPERIDVKGTMEGLPEFYGERRVFNVAHDIKFGTDEWKARMEKLRAEVRTIARTRLVARRRVK